ncbi:hypothetical protein BGZ46_001586, partial [Entomortierella lignicola]
SYMLKEKRSLFMMIVPLMVLMWLTSAFLIWILIPDMDFVEGMILAACVTPTDPVLSNSVVKGRFAEKHVPPRIRYLLSAESGINDGMGLPFLYLGLYLLRERTVGGAFAKWFYMIWVYQIFMSIVLGGIIGAAARKLVKGAKNRNLIDKESFLVFSIALALAVTGCVSILASDDLLAVFIAGNVFAWDDWFSNEIAEAHIQEIIDMLLNLACFVYIGASIPFSKFHDLMLELSIWRLIVLAIVILLFRRMPFVVLMKRFIPALTTYREAAFAGWFGPIGVGAVYLSKVTAEMTNPDNMGDNPYNVERLLRVRSVIFPVVMFMVFSSVLIHGVTVPLLHLQYKYTRTWSRKREESSHAVTRLPHINIGDEIVLRPPAASGSFVGLVEGVEGLNQRSLGHGSSIGYFGNGGNGGGGFGTADLSRVSNISMSRTLEDVVQEMKEASKSKIIRSPSYTTYPNGDNNDNNDNNGVVVYPASRDDYNREIVVATHPMLENNNSNNNNNNNHYANQDQDSNIPQSSDDTCANTESESSGHSSTTISVISNHNTPILATASYQGSYLQTHQYPHHHHRQEDRQDAYGSHHTSESETHRQTEHEDDDTGLITIVTHGENKLVVIVNALVQ